MNIINLKYFLFEIKKNLINIFFGFKYKTKGIIRIPRNNLVTRNKIKFNEILPGYYINDFEYFESRLINETNFEMKPIYCATIFRGRVITDLNRNLGVFDKGNYIVEELTFTYTQNADGGFCHGVAEQNFFYNSKRIEAPRFIRGTVFSLLTGGGKNFNIYHWFFDSLSRLYAIKDEIEKVDYFLVPEYVQEYQIESLKYFGIEGEKVISSLQNKHVIAKELICTTHPRTATYSVRKELTNYLRNQFTKVIENRINDTKVYPTSFYISRKDAPRRKVEDEELFTSKLKEIGIETVEISKYTFDELVYLFKNATFILSTHSAALANILFCKPGTKIIEYFPNLGYLPYYKELSHSLGLEYHEIINDIPLNNDIKSRYDIQRNELISINLELLLNKILVINENCIS